MNSSYKNLVAGWGPTVASPEGKGQVPRFVFTIEEAHDAQDKCLALSAEHRQRSDYPVCHQVHSQEMLAPASATSATVC